jgi:hypothetical protein
MAPSFVINPRSDDAFVATVEGEGAGATSATALEERLRETYPKAVVRPRQLAGEQSQVWYVYRDGHWVAPNDSGD